MRISTPFKNMSAGDKRRMLEGLLFVSPWIIGFIGFTLYPLIYSAYISLTRYDLVREPVFIGFENYRQLFTTDPLFWTVIGNTLYFVFISVPMGLIISFLIANLLNTKVVGRSIFRAILYIPSIVPAVCTAMVWQFLLNVQYGAVNGILQWMGLPAVPFFSSPDMAKNSLIMVAIWSTGNAVVVFLAGLQDVPRSLYEAAIVDGANSVQQFFNITVPLMTPVILFNMLMGFIAAFQEFTTAFLITNGGPMNSTLFFAVYLYRQAFRYFAMGKASALAWILFIFVMTFTVTLFKSSARWVYYGGEK